MAYDLKIFDQEKTLDFIATVCEDASPHITVLSSVMQKDDRTLMFGQYCQGISKDNLLRDPKAAILAIDPRCNMGGGLLEWMERKNTGEEHELFNNIPRFRYNAVYGYAYIHLLDIVEFDAIETPSPVALEESVEKTTKIICALPGSGREAALTYVGESLFPATLGFKLLGYIGDDGYPRLIYVPQAAVQNRNRVVFSADLYPDVYAQIPDGAKTAVLSMVPRLGASILVKGTFHLIPDACSVEIERVYNPNVPASGYIYPMPGLQPVRVFEGSEEI